ncbi:MAG TPA: ABC transporter permease [Aggregatilinea sp.]|jgi:peptide/nickel transport system permease protein|uniref:oligopeptide ABC transporter permease n=1 Tax=Aggregatilinea sp. TaxID=2806333 RepID=UPI002B9DEB75|nr:oligopeptide ABC transporter permease [Aggregatilinea sp.]HML20284.1 ABC transporter permease [Aggregatilinea sp.]
MTEHIESMTNNSVPVVNLEANARIETPTQIAWRRFRRHRLAFISLIVLVIITVMAIGAPLFTQYNPDEMSLRDRALAPSSTHWLGTDNLGRDMWSRTVYGGRVSLEVGLAAAGISTVIGVILGAISGYYGRWVDMVIMRITDVVMTFPPIIIMLTVAAIAGTGLLNVILIIGGLRWPATTRLVRGQYLSLKNQEFVLAARTMGLPDWIIITRHILPSVMAPLMANVTFAVSAAILAEAGLSFLGMGIPLPTPTWGNIMENARSLTILQDKPWMWMPAAAATLLTVLCINFVGDGLRDALDPQQQMS